MIQAPVVSLLQVTNEPDKLQRFTLTGLSRKVKCFQKILAPEKCGTQQSARDVLSVFSHYSLVPMYSKIFKSTNLKIKLSHSATKMLGEKQWKCLWMLQKLHLLRNSLKTMPN
jgi:hypothetical protein